MFRKIRRFFRLHVLKDEHSIALSEWSKDKGDEYPQHQHIANRNGLGIVDEYQIQFHNFIESSESKRDTLITELSKTHKRTWCYKFVWENWKRI